METIHLAWVPSVGELETIREIILLHGGTLFQVEVLCGSTPVLPHKVSENVGVSLTFIRDTRDDLLPVLSACRGRFFVSTNPLAYVMGATLCGGVWTASCQSLALEWREKMKVQSDDAVVSLPTISSIPLFRRIAERSGATIAKIILCEGHVYVHCKVGTSRGQGFLQNLVRELVPSAGEPAMNDSVETIMLLK